MKIILITYADHFQRLDLLQHLYPKTFVMSTVINQSLSHPITEKIEDARIAGRFLNWCEAQEESRLLWTGLGLVGHGCVITPLTFLTVAASGANTLLMLITMLSMVAVLIVNLAALPTRITIPVILLTIVVDLLIVAACIFSGFNIP